MANTLSDSPELQRLLGRIFPQLTIEGIAKKSGQRVVYFCRFERPPVGSDREDWSSWGDVVLKVSSGGDPQSVAYLQMEIGVLNSLSSAYFPTLHFNEIYSEDPETEERLPEALFITIETRIGAAPLGACSAQFSTEAAVSDLLLKLIDGLVLLWEHDRRLVHRDLKPDNILIRKDGTVAIIDLGIVREAGSPGITSTGAMFGPLSPAYAAPEQAQNDKKNISCKTDFFTLGTIAYELIAQNNPYSPPGATVHEVLKNVCELAPERLDVKCGCSSRFADVIAKMMEKEPYKRFRTPALLKLALADARMEVR